MAQKYDRTMASLDVRMPWVLSLICLAFIPVLPEYIAPFLAILSLVFAVKDVSSFSSYTAERFAGSVQHVPFARDFMLLRH